ncbi:hypothetical protein MNV49_001960 [Pseudohyphozyma bogoriensis]|nr:hypothetical protein MNV49_001960 [Pseudohyphozyma bogoriensis]
MAELTAFSDPRQPKTILDLPPELKFKIGEECKRQDEQYRARVPKTRLDRQKATAEERIEWLYGRSLVQLFRVNKAFHDALAPLIFETLDILTLGNNPSDDLLQNLSRLLLLPTMRRFRLQDQGGAVQVNSNYSTYTGIWTGRPKDPSTWLEQVRTDRPYVVLRELLDFAKGLVDAGEAAGDPQPARNLLKGLGEVRKMRKLKEE